MDATSLNLEGQLLQLICPFIQTCRSLHSGHFHFLLGQAGQAWKTREAETSKKKMLRRLNLPSMAESTGDQGPNWYSFQSHQGTQTFPSEEKNLFQNTRKMWLK